MILYKDLNQAFVGSLQHVREHGRDVHSRGSNQREVLFYTLCIDDPSALSIDVPARRFNPDYAISEWLWFLSKNPSVTNIGKLAKIWLQIQDENGECESNYGCYLLGDQWDWVKNELLKDPDSRRGTLAINQPHHKGKNNADYPCTQYIHFFIRDNRLHLGINMRSNDAVFGFCNDVFTFCMFQQLMLNDLNKSLSNKLQLGKYYHHAGSFHVYETHWWMMDTILDNYFVKVSKQGWPELNKFELRSNILSENIHQICLPAHPMIKEQIKGFTTTKKEELYVKHSR